MTIFIEHQVAGFLASFVRIAAWTYAAPILGERVVPPRVRVLLAGAIALLISPLRPATSYASLISVVPFEVLFGVVVGAAARFMLAGAEAGGQLIGYQMGLGFAGTFDPIARESSLPTRRIALALAAMAFLAAGGFTEAIRALAMPIDPTAFGTQPLEALIQSSHLVMVVAVRIAAPLILAGFVANVTFALVSKAAPALNVFSVMLAMSVTVSLLVLSATAPAFVRDLIQVARSAVRIAWEVIP